MANKKETPAPFAGEVWDVLSRIDVSMYTEKKGNFTYLSWAWAWQVLMEHYPESHYDVGNVEHFPDGSVSVTMSVCVARGEDSVWRTMYLQVLDFPRGKPPVAIINPNSHDINNTRMRCLAKALSMHGLGSSLYVGMDLPVPDKDRVVSRLAPRPRISADEMYKQTVQKMDESADLGTLKTFFGGGYTYFKKLDDQKHMAALTKKYETLKSAFVAGDYYDAQQAKLKEEIEEIKKGKKEDE